MENKDLGWAVIGLYKKNPMDALSINEIAKRLGKKYPYVHKRTNELVKEKVLSMVTVGRSNLCTLNIENAYARYILGFFELCNPGNLDVPQCKAALLCGKHKKVLYIVGLEKGEHMVRGVETKAVDEKAFKALLLNDTEGIYSSHRILYGIEYYTHVLLECKEELRRVYNPLLRGFL